MGNEIYMNVNITDFGNGRVECFFSESINNAPISSKQIDYNTACRLMWELVLAGGFRLVNINRYDRHIVTRDTYLFLKN